MSMRKLPVVRSAMALAVLAFSSSVSIAAAPGSGVESVIVAYKPGKAAELRGAIANAGGKIVRELGRASAFAVQLPTSGMSTLQASTAVDFVEPDVKRQVLGSRSGKPA